jgi:FkbM family methyltransferase
LAQRHVLSVDGLQSMISYAQNFEDVILARLFEPDHVGFYVDVGAADPDFLSVTKWFYGRGWSGINIEPNRSLYERLAAVRPRDVNLNLGAGEKAAILTFTERAEAELSSFGDAPPDEGMGQQRPVEVKSLDWIIETYAPGRSIDFLKIDVEGWEAHVLRGIDLSIHRPTAIVIESVLPRARDETHGEWEHLIVGRGFEPVYFDGLNRFYIAEERAELRSAFSYPPGVFDQITPSLVITLDHELRTLRASLNASQAAEDVEYLLAGQVPTEALLAAAAPLARLLNTHADDQPMPTPNQALAAVSRAKTLLRKAASSLTDEDDA